MCIETMVLDGSSRRATGSCTTLVCAMLLAVVTMISWGSMPGLGFSRLYGNDYLREETEGEFIEEEDALFKQNIDILASYQPDSNVSNVVENQNITSLERTLVSLFNPSHKLIGPIDACHPDKIAKVPIDSFEYTLISADCGLGYQFMNSTSRKKPWKIALYGRNFQDKPIVRLSGCPVGRGKCPFSNRCQIVTTESLAEAKSSDVIVIFQDNAVLINNFPRKDGQYRVLYWREAFYGVPSIGTQKKFSFQMGVHWFSGVLNPQFFRTPASLLGGITYPHPQSIPFIPADSRKHFAMSIISNCMAASQRKVYITRLTQYLGAKRVHQYGRCGDMVLPPPPIKNAAKIIANYKFYLSFENTIEDGYVTEKLLHALAMPIVPVYYGAPNTPNITITPSFIKASDFSHPKLLADYLLYLDSNKDEYYQYHIWRTNPRFFHPQYLNTMKMKSPGPYEMLPLRDQAGEFYPRAAACCRLCDENYLKWATEDRDAFVQGRWTTSMIERRFFQGDFYGEPK